MGSKSVKSQLFTLVGLIFGIITSIEKPKGSIEAYTPIR